MTAPVTRVCPTVPPMVMSAGLAELIKHQPIVVRSGQVNFSDDTSVNLIELPGGILIKQLQVNVSTAFEASGASAAATATITVPGDTGAITMWDAGGTLLQILTSDAYSPSTNAGWVHVPDSGGYVTFLQTPGTTTVGVAEVYLEYIPNVGLL